MYLRIIVIVQNLWCLLLCICRDLLAKSASGNNSSSIISLLEAHNSDGQTALHLACRRGCPQIVDAILEYGNVDVDVPDENGNPPIVFALAVGSSECVRALIRKSANAISRSMEGFGRSVAHVCAYYGQPDCMRVSFHLASDGLRVLTPFMLLLYFLKCSMTITGITIGGSWSQCSGWWWWNCTAYCRLQKIYGLCYCNTRKWGLQINGCSEFKRINVRIKAVKLTICLYEYNNKMVMYDILS